MAFPNYEFFNSQDRKRNFDCTIRALMKLENLTWEAAYIMLAQSGLIVKDIMNSTRAIEHLLTTRLGYKKGGSTKPPKGGRWPKIFMFAADRTKVTLPGRKVFIFTRGHVVAAMDGKYYDSWDSGRMSVTKWYYKD